jgi:4-aminobutyrate aminotransferase/(S)-3-amino-2-methylpropionate transaminase
MQELRRITEQHGIVLVADEIQTGYGRTGRMFAIEHSGIAADLVTVAKSMAGGLPISGVVGRAEVMDAAEPGGLGGTYAGNPLACAAALAVLDIFEEERLVERAERLGLTLRERLLALQARHAEVGDVRGLGPMIAMELVQDRESKVPAPALAGGIIEKAREGGLILLKAGLYNNVVRMLAPLVIEDALVERAFVALESAMEQVLTPGTGAVASH